MPFNCTSTPPSALSLLSHPLDDASNVLECAYKQRTGVDLTGTLLSALFLPMIYTFSYTSLRLWRAIQLYDALNPSKPVVLSKKVNWVSGFLVLGVLFLALFATGILVVHVQGSSSINVMVVTLSGILFYWAGYFEIVRTVIGQLDSHSNNRLQGRYIFSPVRSVSSKRHITLTSLLVVFSVVYLPLDLSIGLMAVGHGHSWLWMMFDILLRKNLVSVRKILLAISLLASLAGPAVVTMCKELWKNPSLDFDDALKELRPVISMCNMPAGMIMSIILRYEYARHFDTVGTISLRRTVNAMEETGTHTKKPMPTPDHTNNISVIIQQTTTPFSAPLFHMCLAVFALCHVPALILTIPHVRQHYANTFLFTVFATVRPALLTLVCVPLVVSGAVAMAPDGANLWVYEENWGGNLVKSPKGIDDVHRLVWKGRKFGKNVSA